MVVLDVGLNKAANVLSADITQGQWGSGTDIPLVTDTALTTPIAATLGTTSNVISNNTIQLVHTVDSTTANGVDFSEYCLKYTDNTLVNKVLGATFSKTATFEVTTITSFTVTR